MPAPTPPIITEGFAVNGSRRTIPVPSQILITPGAASFNDGFPPVTMIPISSGGLPPSGLDMNGVLFMISAHTAFLQAGQRFAYDATVAGGVAGYAKGAELISSDQAGSWINTIDANAAAPESGVASGWVPGYFIDYATVSGLAGVDHSLTPLEAGPGLIILQGTLIANINIIFPTWTKSWLVLNQCVGAHTVTAKTAGGTGVELPPAGTSRPVQIWGDGTNIQQLQQSINPRTLNEVTNNIIPASTLWVPGSARAGDARRYGLVQGSMADQSAAIQASIDSGEPLISFPPGDYYYSTTLNFDRAVRFDGAGAQSGDSGAIGNPGKSTTRFFYTGASDAIHLIGSQTEGKENIHLSNFALWGNVAAGHGIVGGTGTLVTRSSLQNLQIRNFTRVGFAGLRIQNMLESLILNVFSEDNYNGLDCSGGTPTTLCFINCQFYNSGLYGALITSLSSSNFIDCDFESSQSDGIHMNGPLFAVDFFNSHLEANNLSAGTAPIYASGGVICANFWGGICTGAGVHIAGRSIDLDNASNVAFHRMQIDTLNAGFARATANTLSCVFEPIGGGWGVPTANVTGNHPGGVNIPGVLNTSGFHADALAGAGVQNISPQDGVILLRDLTHNKTALLSLNSGANTVSILSDPDAGFTNAAGAGNNKINVYSSGGTYVVNNGYAAAVNLNGQVFLT